MKPSDVLNWPASYMFFQWMVGGLRARQLFLREFAGIRSGLRVLDIGCGPGYIARDFRDCHYVGFDVDRSHIEYARSRFGAYGEFHHGLLTENGLAAIDPFDLVMMNGVLHHLDDGELEDVLRLARRALAPGGRLITMDGYYGDNQSWIAKAMLDGDRGRFVRAADGYLKYARQAFPNVVAHFRDNYFYLPYPIIVLECS
jgi:SAM-dependent methyltransferase